jgi:hypothetical protein
VLCLSSLSLAVLAVFALVVQCTLSSLFLAARPAASCACDVRMGRASAHVTLFKLPGALIRTRTLFFDSRLLPKVLPQNAPGAHPGVVCGAGSRRNVHLSAWRDMREDRLAVHKIYGRRVFQDKTVEVSRRYQVRNHSPLAAAR